jgi:hypothetical protein
MLPVLTPLAECSDATSTRYGSDALANRGMVELTDVDDRRKIAGAQCQASCREDIDDYATEVRELCQECWHRWTQFTVSRTVAPGSSAPLEGSGTAAERERTK